MLMGKGGIKMIKMFSKKYTVLRKRTTVFILRQCWHVAQVGFGVAILLSQPSSARTRKHTTLYLAYH